MKARTTKTEVWRGTVTAIYPDGSRWATERTVTTIDDWRETPFGPMNFGHISLGPMRNILLDVAPPHSTVGETIMTDHAQEYPPYADIELSGKVIAFAVAVAGLTALWWAL